MLINIDILFKKCKLWLFLILIWLSPNPNKGISFYWPGWDTNGEKLRSVCGGKKDFVPVGCWRDH
jgi:hypothetical protein